MVDRFLLNSSSYLRALPIGNNALISHAQTFNDFLLISGQDPSPAGRLGVGAWPSPEGKLCFHIKEKKTLTICSKNIAQNIVRRFFVSDPPAKLC